MFKISYYNTPLRLRIFPQTQVKFFLVETPE